MSKLKVGFSKHDVLYQIERSRQIQVDMTGNANFPTPSPTLAAVKTATDACEVAYNDAIHGDKVLKELFKERRKDMLALINQLADYVSNIAVGDKEIILSSGFSVVKVSEPTPLVGQVMNLHLHDAK